MAATSEGVAKWREFADVAVEGVAKWEEEEEEEEDT